MKTIYAVQEKQIRMPLELQDIPVPEMVRIVR
jgi:hypothetical protein